jgi:REP element-mobilizing transposase RayT
MEKAAETDKYKDILIESMQFLATYQRVIIYGFVIMINHIHVIWQMNARVKRSCLQRDFLKFTAQKNSTGFTEGSSAVVGSFLCER